MYTLAVNRKCVKDRVRILHCLVEGMSIAATARLNDCSSNTVLKFLRDIGQACWVYQDSVMRDLPCQTVQVDELWSFVYSKQKNTPNDRLHEAGNVWIWVAMCADTKLVPTWYAGTREADSAKKFIRDLSKRVSGRIQLTTDGYTPYKDAVEEAFGANIDYARLVKNFNNKNEDGLFEILKDRAIGNPKEELISTSFIERQNLTLRMSNRRFTRKTNGFSKKIENHNYSLAVHYMYYNFVRIHQTLRITPAMASGVTNKLWSLEDMVGLMEWKFEIK